MSDQNEEIAYLKRKSKRSPYDPRLVLKIVKLIESGIPRRAIEEEYGVTHNSLTKWLRAHGSSHYKSQMKKFYSSPEKRSVVRAVEGGMSLKEAEVSFALSKTTIQRWLTVFKEENTEISVSTSTDMAKKKTDPSAAEIKALQQALSEANLKIKALDTLIDIAEEQLKIDIRKKSGARQSPK
ncbi:MAG: hypothetical protein MUP99_14220 [Pedobacter sp.]|nr:hypothetical protein [Pedobacter sp.]